MSGDHNFQLVVLRPGQRLGAFCLACNRIICGGDERLWVDRNGPAFKAYYCDGCKVAADNADRGTDDDKA